MSVVSSEIQAKYLDCMAVASRILAPIAETKEIVFIKNFLTKTNKFIFFKYFFEFLSCY